MQFQNNILILWYKILIIMTEKQVLKEIFDYRNEAIAERIERSYEYAAYLRMQWKNGTLAVKAKSLLFRSFGYEAHYQRVNQNK